MYTHVCYIHISLHMSYTYKFTASFEESDLRGNCFSSAPLGSEFLSSKV